MDNVGVLLGLALLIALALRGVNVMIASLLAALVVAATNGLSIPEALTVHYTSGPLGAFTFAGRFFLLFLTGAVFGRVMGETHSAQSIAMALARSLGAERTLLIGMIACAVLTYCGVNVFIVIFTVYPLGLGLMRQANMPKRLFNGACSLGAGTFTMTALPFSPSIHNVIAATNLKTGLDAAPFIGIVAAVLMIGMGMTYLQWEWKRAKERGEGFHASPTDVLPDDKQDTHNLPHWLLASVPLAVVVLLIVMPNALGAFFKAPGEGDPAPTGLAAVVLFAKSQPLLWPSIALTIGTLVALALHFKTLAKPLGTLSRGAENSIMPLINTAAVIGFGGVVEKTEGFKQFANMIVNLDIHPLLSAFLSVNVVAGIVGSSSGGLGIFMQALAPQYLATGVDPALLHRIVTLGSGGLDSLPHCGAVITTLTIMGLTHKDAYKDVFVITVIVPIVATLAVLALAIAMGG
ncbi:MAG: hypothetical protein AMXMBFR84_31060 [Candidatus Hydrogenedentota bacterium]